MFVTIVNNIKLLPMRSVSKLLNLLENNTCQKKGRQHYYSNNNNNDEEEHFEQLKAEMSKHYKPAWKMSSVYQKKDKLLTLKNKQLDNWQIARISLSKRSYVYPKNYHGMKIPSVGKQFINYNSKDAQGHFPYLYQGDLKKIQKIRQQIHQPTFARTNTVRHQYFGFQKLRPNQSQLTKKRILNYSVS